MISAVNEFLDDLRGGRMTEAPVVTVEQGQLQGRVANSPSGKAFYSFQGIPYAKPPLGSLRFKAPQPAEPWEGIRDATSEGNVSAQIEPLFAKEYIGDENCLFLNVYTPNLDGEFLPVMVWIHGGGYKFGSGNSNLYGGDFLVERDVVVVTLNYRCGPLGFLCLNTPEVPGNAGMKDVVQALRWVKENIQNFGGNPGNITVFGESAGGAAVSILTASPMSKNLISKAVIQSGNALCYWGVQNTPIDNARELAKELGCEAEDVDEILEFLSTTPAKDIVEAHGKLYPPSLDKTRDEFAVVVEKEFPGVESLINEAFIDILTSGRVADIPIMIGTTSLEFAAEQIPDLKVLIPKALNIDDNSEEADIIVEKMKSLYLKSDEKEGFYHLLSDACVNADVHRYIQYLIQVSNKPIYFYKFDYVGELNIAHNFPYGLGLKRPMHMDELGYLFKNELQQHVEPTPQDVKMRERMLRLWTNFAKTGNPTPDENHYLPVTWQPVAKDNLYYLHLGPELSLNKNPDQERMEFWEELYRKYFKIWDHPKTNNIEAPRREPDIVQTFTETVIVSSELKSSEVIETREYSEVVHTSESFVESEVTEAVTEHQETVTAAIPEPEPIETEQKPEPVPIPEPESEKPEPESLKPALEITTHVKTSELVSHFNGNGVDKKVRTSNEIKMVQNSNGAPKDVIRANDPPEDDLPKNIGVNKFVNFFESLGGKK